jgi:hypothetical protein
MSLDNSSILTGATFAAPTGGSAQVLSRVGGSQANQTNLVFDGDTTYATRRKVRFTGIEPAVSASAPTGYGKQRKYMTLKIPVDVLGDGSLYEDAIYKVEASEPTSVTIAETTENLLLVSQMCSDSDFTPFWTLGDQA